MKNKCKVFLISSKTGGHAYPIMLLYKELVKNNISSLILHSGSSIEQELFLGTNNVKIIASQFNEKSILKKILSYFLNLLGLVQAKYLLLYKRPKLIISKGGYVSVPVLLVAKILKIPYVIHESDSNLGLANRIFSCNARLVYLGFPKELYGLDSKDEKYQYIGQIVSETKRLKNHKKTIYITGGSQGAESINSVVYSILEKLTAKYIVYHQVGEHNLNRAKEHKNKLKENANNYIYFGFSLDQSRNAIACADLIISRAGANTIGEIAINKKASILIPYPYATADHQTTNAKYLEKSGSAIMIREKDLTGGDLLKKINYLLSDSRNIQILGAKIDKNIKSSGLESIVKDAVKFIKELQ